MNPFEEYCKRHGLNCPVVKRTTSRWNVIYRIDPERWRGSSWSIFQIVFKLENYKPSYFNFSWLTPSRSAGGFERISHPNHVEWDSYDMEVMKAANEGRNMSISVVQNLSEAKLAAWEMFLFIYDKYVATLASEELKLKVYESIDPMASIEERMKSVEDFIRLIHDARFRSLSGESRLSTLISGWDKVTSYCDPGNYACWLAEIVNNIRNSSEYLEEFSNLNNVA